MRSRWVKRLEGPNGKCQGVAPEGDGDAGEAGDTACASARWAKREGEEHGEGEEEAMMAGGYR